MSSSQQLEKTSTSIQSVHRYDEENALHIVWQYNSEFGLCNYKCPYCYYQVGELNRQVFKMPTDLWRDSFKKSFGDRDIIFYFSFGEPTIGRGFMDILDMIAAEPRWRLHITSNLSLPIVSWQKIVNHDIVKKGKLFINASFHPTEISAEEFTKRLLFLRQHGIECPIVLVAWPPTLEKIEEYYQQFNKHNFVIHIRRFVGWYKGKHYPRSYTDEERKKIAKFMDDASIKYTLNYEIHLGRESTAGMNYILTDENGDVWESPDSRGKNLGNIFTGQVSLYDKPRPYSGTRCASVQGVASLVELRYGSLPPNFVTNFARKGGVYKRADGTVFYKNMHTNFDDPEVRKEYLFPSGFRKLKQQIFIHIFDPLYREMYLRLGHERVNKNKFLRYFVMFMFAANTYPPVNITQGYWEYYMVKGQRYTPPIIKNPKTLARMIHLLTPGI